MQRTEIISDEDIATILNHASDLLWLSCSEIETKYANYPLSHLQSVDSKYKSTLEIRFDKENIH